MTKYEFWYNKAIEHIKTIDIYPSIEKLIGYVKMCDLSNAEYKIATKAIMDATEAHRKAYLKAHPIHAKMCSSVSESEAFRIWKAEGGSSYLETL